MSLGMETSQWHPGLDGPNLGNKTELFCYRLREQTQLFYGVLKPTPVLKPGAPLVGVTSG